MNQDSKTTNILLAAILLLLLIVFTGGLTFILLIIVGIIYWIYKFSKWSYKADWKKIIDWEHTDQTTKWAIYIFISLIIIFTIMAIIINY